MVRDGCYTEYSWDETISAEYSIRNSEYYGTCVNYRNDGTVYRKCEYNSDSRCVVLLYDDTNKMYAKSIIDDKYKKMCSIRYENNKKIISKHKMDNAKSALLLLRPRAIESSGCIYKGELGINIFHYVDDKVSFREKNNIVVKYYKNSYRKDFYKNKPIFFY